MKPQDQGRTYISFDWALKRLLRNKASYVILEGFLSELLKEDIKIQDFLDPENNVDFADHKFSRADVLCLNSKGELILIEVQYHREEDYFHRMLFGASRVLTERLILGQPYGKLPKVYSVHIVYFDLGVGTDYVYHGRLHFTGQHQGDELGLSALQQERFGRHEAGELFPEYYLLKINNFDEVAKDSLDEWLYYFKHSSLPQRYHAKGLTEVAEQLKIDAMDAATKAKYQKYLDAQLFTESALESAYDNGLFKGRDLGIKEGIELGEKQERQKSVLKLASVGIPHDTIAAAFGISVEEVRAILEQKGLTEVAKQLKMDAMDAATKSQIPKYLDAQLFTESALESAYDNGLFKGRDLGKQEGIKEGIKEGIELGELQERQKSIVKLASVGITHDTIAAAFGISVDEVRAILEQRH